MKGGLRQSMAWLHTWTGLPVGWVLFFMFLTGTLGYFDSEIDRWMRPEAPLSPPAQSQLRDLHLSLDRLREVAPAAGVWTVFPRSGRDVPVVSLSWRPGVRGAGGAGSGRGREVLDARTGSPLATRETGGGQTLYQLHYTLYYLPSRAATWLVGVCSMFMLIAIVSGVITHKKIFADLFTFRPRLGQRSWLDFHNLLSVTALPFHLVITYSGLVFFMFTYMSPVVETTYGRGQRDLFFDEAFRNPEIPPPAADPAPMASLGAMYEIVERRWGASPVRVVSVYNPGDRNARVVFTRTHIDPTSNGGRIVFDGASGAVLEAFDRRTGPMAVNHALLGLHEGLFAGPLVRWLYFFTGLLGTAMVGTGLVLWTAKRRDRLSSGGRSPSPAILVVERLNVGTIAGLPIAVAAYFWANRLLPVGMADRAQWEVHVLFLTWLATLVAAGLRPPRRAWIEQLGLAAIAYAALPLLNAVTTDQHLGRSIPAGAWAVAGFDLAVLAAGLGFAAAGLVLYRRAATDEVSAAAEGRRDRPFLRPPSGAGAPAALPEDAAG